MLDFHLKNIGNLENVGIGSILGMRRAPRQVFQSTRPFVRIKIIHVSIDEQTLTTISQKDFENELANDPDFGSMFRASWPADRPCAVLATCNWR